MYKLYYCITKKFYLKPILGRGASFPEMPGRNATCISLKGTEPSGLLLRLYSVEAIF